MDGKTRRPFFRRGRRAATGIAMTITAIATSFVVAAPAHADFEVLTFRNRATGRCLDSDYRKEAYTLPCNGGNHQKWRLEQVQGSQRFQIRNVATSRCLIPDTMPGTKVYTDGCPDWDGSFDHYVVYWTPIAGNAKWAGIRYRTTNDDWSPVVITLPGISTPTILDGNSAGNVYLSVENGGAFQFWDH